MTPVSSEGTARCPLLRLIHLRLLAWEETQCLPPRLRRACCLLVKLFTEFCRVARGDKTGIHRMDKLGTLRSIPKCLSGNTGKDGGRCGRQISRRRPNRPDPAS